jgi:hypothetical protein
VNVRVECPGCGTNFIVMPSRFYKTIGDQFGLEGEVGFREKLKNDKAQTGDRLTVADVDRFYTCPDAVFASQAAYRAAAAYRDLARGLPPGTTELERGTKKTGAESCPSAKKVDPQVSLGEREGEARFGGPLCV